MTYLLAYLFLSEIFYSLQGEGPHTGLPTIFIRLAGCPLRCPYCDTKYALTIKQGRKTKITDIISKISKYPCQRICLTGGEPLWQPNSIALIKKLLRKKYQISIETSGAVQINKVPKKAEIIMDIKTPSSTHHNNNLWKNLKYLKKSDSIKFVISDQQDFNWSLDMIKKYRPQCNLLISPVWEMPLSAKKHLAESITKSPFNLRLSLQMHKIINIQ